ncbi:hypothetical protein [Haloferula sargassicola]|uniref:Uncharacterized protein n=1 Tax=Haloferula sargassicola TaxID=490096 RepID=A0ABP9UTL8_9BACT
MEQDQLNYLKMAVVTDELLDQNESVWSGLPAFASEVATSRALIARIQGGSRGQSGIDTRPFTQQKEIAKKTIARLGADLGAPASVLAETQGDLEAAAKLNQSYSDLYYATDAEADDLAYHLLQAARALDPAALANYGVSAEQLEQFDAAVENYQGLIGSPRVAIAKRSAHTVSLPELFVQLRASHDRLDRLAVIFRKTAPDFLAAYEAARVIVDRPATHGAGETPEPTEPEQA